MKKRILPVILLISAMVGSFSIQSCQKIRLVEEWPDGMEEPDARYGQPENNDTASVTPDFDVNGWEGSIDADFTFGGEEKD